MFTRAILFLAALAFAPLSVANQGPLPTDDDLPIENCADHGDQPIIPVDTND